VANSSTRSEYSAKSQVWQYRAKSRFGAPNTVSNRIFLKDKDGKLQECPDGKGWEKRDIGDIMDLIDESWATKIKEACRDKVENDNNVQVEDEHRINRMAAYMMMVDTASIKDDTAKVELLFDYILRREPFDNINPNNPPRFVGQSFDYVRMKPDETSISHQERRIPPSALKR